jgi:anti-sigma-K factor RskA
VEQELVHDLVAAYALDALDDSERREFEEHLAGCERCRNELEGLRDAAAALAYVPEGPAPPPELRERVLARVREGGRSNVVPLRRRYALPAVATLAVAAAAAAIALAFWASSLSSSLDRKAAITRVLGDPAAAQVRIGPASRVVVGSSGRAVLVSSLAPAPGGKTYELWVIEGGKALPAGLFRSGGAASPVLLDRRVPVGARVGLSVERSGGAKRPTHVLAVTAPV